MTSDAATDVIEKLAKRYKSAERVYEHVQDERPRAQVSARDILTTLRQEAALALVLESSASADILAYAPAENGVARYEHWAYDKVSELMGDPPEECRWTETIGRRAAVKLLEDRLFRFALRTETPLEQTTEAVEVVTGP